MKSAHIVLGTPLKRELMLKKTKNEEVYIGVDRGALYLVNAGIAPDLAIGDFDSINPDEINRIYEEAKKVSRFNSDKDDTDAELAVKVTKEMFYPEKYVFHNWTGGRVDHLISLLFLAQQPRFSDIYDRFVFVNQENTLKLYKPGNHRIQKEKDKKYVSFVGMTPLSNVTLKGVKYPLNQVDFNYMPALVSNEFKEQEADFSFEKGILAVIQSTD